MPVVYAVSKDEMHITYHVWRKEMGHITIPSYVDIDTQHRGFIAPSRGNSLDEVYGSYSGCKAIAWERCESICTELDGRNLCITSSNTFVFTAQFEFNHPENGRPMVCRITPRQTYAMYLDMHHIEMARFVWQEYARKTSIASFIEQDYEVGGCRVMWICHRAYIVIDDEVYRVLNPFRRDRGLRIRAILQLCE